MVLRVLPELVVVRTLDHVATRAEKPQRHRQAPYPRNIEIKDGSCAREGGEQLADGVSHGGAGRVQPPAWVDELLVGQRAANRAGQGDVEGSADVDLGDARAHRVAEMVER